MPSRTASVLLDRLEPAWSHSAVQGVRRLTQLRCWVVPGRDSSSSASSGRRVTSLHSSVRLRRGHTWPPFLQALRHFSLRAVLADAVVRTQLKRHKAFRASRTRPSRPLAQTVSVIADLFGSIRRRPESALPATDCAVPHASTSLPPASIRRSVPVREDRCTPHQSRCCAHSFGPSRPRPRRPSSHPSRQSLPLLQGACSLPSAALQSPPLSASRPPPRPRSTRFARSAPLVTGRLAGGSRIEVRGNAGDFSRIDPPACKTPSNQGQPETHAQTASRNPPASHARADGK